MEGTSEDTGETSKNENTQAEQETQPFDPIQIIEESKKLEEAEKPKEEPLIEQSKEESKKEEKPSESFKERKDNLPSPHGSPASSPSGTNRGLLSKNHSTRKISGELSDSSGYDSGDSGEHAGTTRRPSRLVKIRNEYVDERELTEAIITPVNIEPPAIERKQPKDPIILIQSLYRMRRVKRRFKKIVKCSYIVREVLQTEKAYVDSLHFAIETYKKGLSEKSVISKKEVETLFFGLDLILVCNQQFSVKLEKRVENWNVESTLGDIFIDLSQNLSTYTSFINNYDRALETLRKSKQQSSFATFLSEIESQKKNKLTLGDILIMPVQRVPRYVLLLGMILENLPKHHKDKENLDKALEEIKKMAKYIDEKKGEAMSKVKVGEIQSSMTNNCPNLQTETRLFVKDADLVCLIENERCLRHFFIFNDAILVAQQHPLPGQHKKPTYEFEALFLIDTINLVSPIPIEDFSVIRGTNYLEPNAVMNEIQKLNSDLEKERKIEQSAAKIAQLYKQEQSSKMKKEQLKETTETTESQIEILTHKLKLKQEQMRLFEPRYGLVVATNQKTVINMILRSEGQRDEWIKEINYLRQKAGQLVNKEAEFSMLDRNKPKKEKEGFLSSITKGVGDALGKTVVKSLQFFVRGMTSDYTEAQSKVKMLPTSEQKRMSVRLNQTNSQSSSQTTSPIQPSANAPLGQKANSASSLDPDLKPIAQTNSNTHLKASGSHDSLKEKDKKTRSMTRSGSTPFDSSWVAGMDAYETHNFITKSYKRLTHCDFCGDIIWGLGREGVKCTDCSYRAHRKCSRQIKQICSKIPDVIIDQLDEEDNPDTIISTSGDVIDYQINLPADGDQQDGDNHSRKSSTVMKGIDQQGVIMLGGEPDKGLKGWRGSDLNLEQQDNV